MTKNSKQLKKSNRRAKARGVRAGKKTSLAAREIDERWIMRKPESLDHETVARSLDSAVMPAMLPVQPPKRDFLQILKRRKAVKPARTRMVAVSLAVALFVTSGVSLLSVSSSFFNDTEAGDGQQATGILDFSLTPGDWQPDKKLKPGDETSREIEVAQEGTLEFVYEPKVEITGGKLSFCNALVLTAYLGSEQQYQGPLADLQIPEPVASQHQETDWNFVTRLPAQLDNFDDEKCKFNFVFTAWQEELTSVTGFTDTEVVENEIRSAKKEHQGDDCDYNKQDKNDFNYHNSCEDKKDDDNNGHDW